QQVGNLRYHTSSGATEAFATVQTFVAGAVAHGHVAAIRTGGRILLEVSNGVAKGFDSAGRRRRAMRLSISAWTGGFQVQQVRVLGNWKFRHRPVDVSFDFFNQTGDRQLRLI